MLRTILKRLMNVNRLWLLFGLAVVLGVISTFLSSSYLKSREKNISEELKRQMSGGPTIEVLVSSTDLPSGAALGETLVKREVPLDLVEEDALTPNDFERILGAKLTRPLRAGYPINGSFFVEKSKTFSDAVAPGMRAITIEVDEINSMAQMVKPGNRVDLMLITPDRADPEGSGIEVIMVLQNVKVMATGQSINAKEGDVRSRASSMPAGNQQSTYTNFTFEVSPQDAAVIALAQGAGKIRAVLRKAGDDDRVVLNDVNSRRLLNVDEKNAQKRKYAANMRLQDIDFAEDMLRSSSRRPGIEYIIGGMGAAGAGGMAQSPAAGAEPAGAKPQDGRPAAGAGSAVKMDKLQNAISDALKGSGVPADVAGLPSARSAK